MGEMTPREKRIVASTPTGLHCWYLSFWIPGWGQLCQGRGGMALLTFLGTPTMYILDWRWGIVLHLLCVFNAWHWTFRFTRLEPLT